MIQCFPLLLWIVKIELPAESGGTVRCLHSGQTNSWIRGVPACRACQLTGLCQVFDTSRVLPNIEVWTDAWLLMPGSGRCSRGGWWFWTTADSFGSRDAKLAWSKVTAWHEGTKKHMCFLQTSGWSTVLVVYITYVRHKPICDTWMIWDNSR